MIITQGYASSWMTGFNFLERHGLRKYSDPNAPLVVFGCYVEDDYNIINNHKSLVVIRWCGGDSLRIKDFNFFKKENFIHITPLIKVYEFLNNNGIKCYLKRAYTESIVSPILLGNKVYAYLPKNNSKYYGSDIVNVLKNKYDFIIGDLSISQENWRNGACETFYSQTYIGIALSSYAGGAGGVIEMGLRGIKVMTNVIELPNTTKWITTEDIENFIIKEKENIGNINTELSNDVYNYMIHDMKYFDLDKILNTSIKHPLN